MTRHGRIVLATLSALCAAPVASRAADETVVPPDPEFLEYLGSWDGDDEDWLVAAATLAAPRDASRPGTKIDGGDGDVPAPQEQKR